MYRTSRLVCAATRPCQSLRGRNAGQRTFGAGHDRWSRASVRYSSNQAGAVENLTDRSGQSDPGDGHRSSVEVVHQQEERVSSQDRWYHLSNQIVEDDVRRPPLHPFPRLPPDLVKLQTYLEPLLPDSLCETKYINLSREKAQGESWVSNVLVCIVETESGRGRSVPNVTEGLYTLLRDEQRQIGTPKETWPVVNGYPQGRHAHTAGRPDWLIIDAPAHDLLIHIVTPAIEEVYSIGQLWRAVSDGLDRETS